MKYLYIKDNKYRKNFFKKEKQRLILKFLLLHLKLSNESRIYIKKKIELLPKNTSGSKIRNRCTITYRSRSVNQKFKLARTPLRDLFLMGVVPGYKKAVW